MLLFIAECNGQDGLINLKPGKEVKIGPPRGIPSEHGTNWMMYYDNERCLWEVKAPQGSYIRIEFESFNVENYCPLFKNPPSMERRDLMPRVCPDAPCTHDYVSLYDGASKQSPRIAKVLSSYLLAKGISNFIPLHLPTFQKIFWARYRLVALMLEPLIQVGVLRSAPTYLAEMQWLWNSTPDPGMGELVSLPSYQR